MNINRSVRTYTKRHKRLGRWHYAVTVLTAVIIFCTVYALILPAITMERPTACGMQEHTHSDACLNAQGEATCGLPEHTHTDACYPANESDESNGGSAPYTATPDEPDTPATPIKAQSSTPIRLTAGHGELAATGAGETGVTLSKQIEHIGSDSDYNYRLHLTVDGSLLKESAVETTVTKRKVVLIVDGTETMTADGMSGEDARRKKFGLAYDFLFGDGDGSAKELLDGNTEVSIMFIGGRAGGGDYTSLYQVAAEKLTDYSAAQNSTIKNKWDSFHLSQQISYNTAWKAIEQEYSTELENNEELSIVFIVGNAPQTLVNIDTGANEGAVSGAAEQNQADGVQWMRDHENVTLYGLGMVSERATDIERGSAEITAIAEASGGSYQTARTQSAFDDVFSQITQTILSGDKITNLTITDSLSGYVSFADAKNLTATLYKGYDPDNDSWSSSTMYDESSPELSVSGDTVTFTRTDEIEGTFKLELSFEIKTKSDVMKDTDTYPSSGYPNTGDADTDYGSNTSSSGKPGFYSNGDAGVSYTLNGEDKTGDFKKPVVQAPEVPLVTKELRVTKHWSGTLAPHPVTLTLYTPSSGGYTVLDTISLSGTQDASETYTYTFAPGETERTIYVVETPDADTLPMYSGTTARINPGTGEVDAAAVTLTAGGSDAEVTVTNWPNTPMPATGGSGQTPFTVVGVILFFAAGCALFYRRKRGS